jgi:parallel beta-helix repeat protein
MRRIVSSMMLAFLLVGTLALTFDVGLVHAQAETVYINSDGSVSPSSAPISSVDNVTYTFTGNISYPAYDGVVVERNNTVIDGNGYAVIGDGNTNGLSLTAISNVTIKNVIITNSYYGIYLWNSSGNVLSSNDVTANIYTGIVIAFTSDNNTLSGNNVTGNTYGIGLDSSSGNVLSGNLMSSNTYNFGVYGGVLNDFVNYVDTSNLVDGKPVYYLMNQSNIVIDPQTYPEGVGYLSLVNCKNVTVQGLALTKNLQGLLLANTTNSEITDNNVTANYSDGVDLEYSSGIILSDNSATANSYYGIYLWNSSSNVFSSNSATANSQYGILLYNSSSNVFSGNNASLNVMAGIYLGYSSGNVLSSNNVTANSYYGIWLYNSSSNVLSSNNLSANNSAGIYLSSSGNNTLVGNDEANNGDGVDLQSSSGNVLSDNNVTASGGVGVDLEYSSDNNAVSGNSVTANGVIGIDLEHSSDNNTVSDNNATANSVVGIYLISSSGNVLCGNDIAANGRYGVWLYSSSGNAVFHNDFLNNTQQAELSNSTNTWDDGYPSGGNYWSDYNGTDLYSGPYQNVTGSDGIGDTPYPIDANNTDHYPLMGAFSDFSVRQGVDVQVVSNSTVSDFQFNGTAILFNVTGANGTTGFCNVRVPTSLLNGTLTVFVNGTLVQYSILLASSNSNQTYLYFTYGHSTEQVTVTPEFPDSLILAMFMLAMLLAITIHKKKHRRSQGALWTDRVNPMDAAQGGGVARARF